MEVNRVSSPPLVDRMLNRISESKLDAREQPRHESEKKVVTSLDRIQESVQEKVQAVSDFLTPLNASVKFTFHEDLNEYYVVMIDGQTEEVIREIPPKKFLDMYAAMVEFMGLFVDKRG